MKKLLSIILSLVLVFSVGAVAFSSVEVSADEIAYSFAQSKWDWWGTAQGTINGSWGQNDKALTRTYADGGVTYSVTESVSGTGKFQQIQDKWKSLPEGDLYINITNNATVSIEFKIVAGSTTLFDQWISAGKTQTINFTNSSTAGFSVFAMNWNTTVSGGENLFTFSAIYYKPTEVETTTQAPSDLDSNVIYPFSASNHNFSKTEGCNPNNNWAWGSFATTSFTHHSDGSVDLHVTEGEYNKYRQMNTNWRNVPATEQTTYLDFTNNSNKAVKLKVTVGGYTTPADADLPVVSAGQSYTLELGVLTGGNIGILLLESFGSDSIVCAENTFSFSGIYTKDEYKPSISLSTAKGAQIRLNNQKGMRFITNIDTKAVQEAVENGYQVTAVGTLIAPLANITDATVNNMTLESTFKFVNVKANYGSFYLNVDGQIAGSLVKIKQANFSVEFAARSYITVSNGEKEYTFYSDCNATDHARTIKLLATEFIETPEFESCTAEQINMVKLWAGVN